MTARALAAPFVAVTRLSLKQTLWLLAVALTLATTSAVGARFYLQSRGPEPLLRLDVPSTDGLLGNSYATWHPTDVTVPRIPNWIITNGSLFARGGSAWSGPLDAHKPDPHSLLHTGSATFRLYSAETFGDVTVRFRLKNLGFGSTPRTPPRRWDGFHILLRVQDEYALYVVSVNRRDDTVGIKEKLPGGPSNGGTYTFVSQNAHYVFPVGEWQDVATTVETNEDRTVTIRLYIDGKPLASATDTGANGKILVGRGKVGIRADNDRFELRDFAVYPNPSSG
jgi:hypothetical protein